LTRFVARRLTTQPALLGRAARITHPRPLARPNAVRWLSQAAEESTAADAEPAALAEAAAKPAVAAASATTAMPAASFRHSMMRSLKDRNYAQVLTVYEAMVEASVPPDLLALNCIIEAKARAEGSAAAQQTLQVLLAQHPTLKPNSNTYVALVRPCEADGNMKLAFSLYDELLSLGHPPDLNIYNSLIAVCTAADDFAAAEGIFTEMRDKGVKPKSMTYLKYIWACFRSRQPDLAYKMLLNMENEWRVPTREDYGRMLKLFKWHQHADGKLHCVQGIVQDVNMHPGSAGSLESLGPDIVSGLFKEAQLRKRPDEVVRLAETLTRGGVKLDRFQLVGVIFAHLSLNEAVKAFSVLVEMYENKLSPPERTVEGIAEELAKHSASVDESYYLLESRKAAGGEVPLPAVNIVIEACAMMGDLDRAFATWAELEQLALQPNTGTFNALLHTCVRTREIASGRRLLSRMAQDGVKPDSKTFMHQASLHVMAREESLALDVLKQCKEANCVPTGKMYVGLINMMIRGRKGNAAKELLEEMRTHHNVSKALTQKVEDASS